MSRPPPPIVPTHWTPKQALAVFEILDELRDRIWESYGPQIQQAIRKDRRTTSRPTPGRAIDQRDLPF